MRLDDHIAKRFLTDDTLKMEIIEYMFPKIHDVIANKEVTDDSMIEIENGSTGEKNEVTLPVFKQKVASLYQLLNTPKTHKPYYCTETMLDCLNLLRINKEGPHYNWTYFDKLPNQVATFIFPNNRMLRMEIFNETMSFIHINYTPKNKQSGNIQWVMFFLNRKTGELCEHFGHPDVQNIERFIYALLCFVYMADNEEVIVPPHTRYGTRKSGKIINSSPFPITIINSKWNVTSIRTEGFTVSPHFAIRMTGPGRSIPKIVFINQYEKHGYVRKGKPETFEK